MPAIQVFSGGIKFLKDHLFRNFQERVPQLQDGDIHWVLTVPAIWDNHRGNSKLKKSFKQIVFMLNNIYNSTPDIIVYLSKSGTM
jgi:hypothetical protein